MQGLTERIGALADYPREVRIVALIRSYGCFCRRSGRGGPGTTLSRKCALAAAAALEEELGIPDAHNNALTDEATGMAIGMIIVSELIKAPRPT